MDMCLWMIYRRQNGEVKPLTVPKDIDLHLEKAPVNAIDALGKTNTHSHHHSNTNTAPA